MQTTIGEIVNSLTPLQEAAVYKITGIVCIGSFLVGAALASTAFLVF